MTRAAAGISSSAFSTDAHPLKKRLCCPVFLSPSYLSPLDLEDYGVLRELREHSIEVAVHSIHRQNNVTFLNRSVSLQLVVLVQHPAKAHLLHFHHDLCTEYATAHVGVILLRNHGDAHLLAFRLGQSDRPIGRLLLSLLLGRDL